MSEELNSHIGSLMMGTDPAPPEQVTEEVEADQLIDEIPDRTQTAIPEGIEDEAVEIDERVARARDDKGRFVKKEEEPDYQALYEEQQRAATGKQGEIDRLREQTRQFNENLEYLRKQMYEAELERQEAAREAALAEELAEERAIYGDDVVDDPGIAYMRDKWMQTQALVEAQQAEADQRRAQMYQAAQEQQAQIARWTKAVQSVKAEEEAFAEQNPDYYDAYDYAREQRTKMYVSRGYAPEQAEIMVNQEEEGIRQEQMNRPGGSVAQAIYEISKMFGWDPSMAKGQEEAAQAPAQQPRTSAPDVTKIKAGLGQRGSGGLRGASGTGKPRTVNREEFFATVSDAERLRILADPDKFEELGRTGELTIDW